MNPVACEHYRKYGGEALVGKSLLACHNARSGQIIQKVLDWFSEDPSHNRVHSYWNEKQNKDVYIIALRDSAGALIGYYEKHEYRTRDMSQLYGF